MKQYDNSNYRPATALENSQYECKIMQRQIEALKKQIYKMELQDQIRLTENELAEMNRQLDEL